MPLLKRKPFVPDEFPDLGISHDDTEVFQIRFTGEVFSSYKSYAERLHIYSQKIWACKHSGKAGLTYEQALESERKSSLQKSIELKKREEAVVLANNAMANAILSSFPECWKKPVLKSVQFSTNTLAELTEYFYNHLSSTFYPREEVTIDLTGTDWSHHHLNHNKAATVVEVIHSESNENGNNGHNIDEMIKVSINNDENSNSESMVVPGKALKKDRKALSKLNIRKFIKFCAIREGWNGSPWIVFSDIGDQYEISQVPPDHIKKLIDDKKNGKTELSKNHSEDGSKKELMNGDSVTATKLSFPTEDTNLWNENYRLDSNIERPVPQKDFFGIPNPLIKDVIYVWNFLNTFGRTLSLFPFTFETFCISIKSNNNNVLISEIFGSLLSKSTTNRSSSKSVFSLLLAQLKTSHIPDEMSSTESPVATSENSPSRPRTSSDFQKLFQKLTFDEQSCLAQWYFWSPGRWKSGLGNSSRILLAPLTGNIIERSLRRKKDAHILPGSKRMKAWEVALLGAVVDLMDPDQFPGKWEIASKILGGGSEVEKEKINGFEGLNKKSDSENDEEDDEVESNDENSENESTSDTDSIEFKQSRRSFRLALKQNSKEAEKPVKTTSNDESFDDEDDNDDNDNDDQDLDEEIIRKTRFGLRSKRPREEKNDLENKKRRTDSNEKTDIKSVNGLEPVALETKPKPQVSRNSKKIENSLSYSDVKNLFNCAERGFKRLHIEEKLKLLTFLIDERVCTSEIIKQRVDECSELLNDLNKEKKDIQRDRKIIQTERAETERRLFSAGLEISSEYEKTIDFTPENGHQDEPEPEILDIEQNVEISEPTELHEHLTDVNIEDEWSGKGRRRSKRRSSARKYSNADNFRKPRPKLTENEIKALLAERDELRTKFDQRDLEILDREAKLEQKFILCSATCRIQPLGYDRYWNRYWWFDDAFGAHVPTHKDFESENFPTLTWNSDIGTGALSYGSGRLFVEDVFVAEDKSNTSEINSTFPSLNNIVHQELPKEVDGEWGFYSDVSQSDLYRRLRYPVILVGDSALGGISTTISSYESLLLRGFDVACVVMFSGPMQNETEIARGIDCPVFTSPNRLPVASASHGNKDDIRMMKGFYSGMDNWATDVSSKLLEKHHARSTKIENMGRDAEKSVWWPFTQHRTSTGKTLVIESALGDYYTALPPPKEKDKFTGEGNMQQYFDACGSWWTQSLGHGDVGLSKAAAYAAGRFGHVIFPECIHEPALDLTKKLLETVGRGWADRVYFSDNGSTAVEVGLKMAFGKMEANLIKAGVKVEHGSIEFDIIGLQGSYHGDTIGAMNISDPNVYNKRVNWYTGKGLWFEPPTISFQKGEHLVRLPASLKINTHDPRISQKFKNLGEIFSHSRIETELFTSYLKFIRNELEKKISSNRIFGALVIEPVILGAGGMIFVDPLFQKAMVKVCQDGISIPGTNKLVKIPVFLDEVFVGLHRLAKPAWSVGVDILGIKPDVSCFAKTLTGGLLPLAVTLATEDVFNCFSGDSKAEALLHGHSYTAHPVGCQVACESLDTYKRDLENLKMIDFSGDWNIDLIDQISRHPHVDGVVALGSIFAVELKANNKGYASQSSEELIQRLRDVNIFARPLGN
ncbi:hypothetical protein HK096_002840, partial [Nowakowskiella sp. JEL0078]